jgi:hypothetical protein
MTNEIVALIVKAQNKNEAEQNAEGALYHICQEGDDSYYDYGIIIGNGRQSQTPPVVMKFREATKANTGLEPIGYQKIQILGLLVENRCMNMRWLLNKTTIDYAIKTTLLSL